MKTKKQRKEKLRERIYDLVYGDDFEIVQDCSCYDTDGCLPSCYKTKSSSSVIYDKLIKLLESSGVHLDREV